MSAQSRDHASRPGADALNLQYRGLLDDIEAIVCEFDLDQKRYTFVSQRIRDILGYPPEALYDNRVFWFHLLPKDQRAWILDEMNRVSEEGGRYSFEHAILTAVGETRILRNVGRVQIGGDGSRILRCVMLDVTAARRAQENEQRRRQLEAVGTLAGGIAHDFNNVLTTILGNLSLAKLQAEIDGPIAELLDQIEEAGHDARRLSYQLLTFARGGQPVLKTCDLARRLRELERASHGRRFSIRASIEEGLPKVLADRQQLNQVLHELMSNAEQAMSDGGLVELEARTQEVTTDGELPLESGPYVALSVRDSGVGVSAEVLPRVFDPYFTTKDAGRGFGLAAVYSIVQAHQGHIAFESEAERGTVVTVWLPQAVEEPQQAMASVGSTSEPSAGRVLLMDDERAVRAVTTSMLEQLGWQVTAVPDGRDAIEAYQEAMGQDDAFDLVVTDLSVPGGMGGAETMRRLLEIDPGVRAVISSGYSNDPVMARYREHGFAGVIAKPFSLADLGQVLAQAMPNQST